MNKADLRKALDTDVELLIFMAAMVAARKKNPVATSRLINPTPVIACQSGLDGLMDSFMRIVSRPATH